MFIVGGDAFPCTRGSWSHLGITLANHGACAREPASYWVIGMAVYGGKDMGQLGAKWRDNLPVWWPRTRSYFVSLSDPSNWNVQSSKNVQKPADLPTFRFCKFQKRFRSFKIVTCFHILQHIYGSGRFTLANMERAATVGCARDSPLIPCWVGVSITHPAQEVGSIYNEAIWNSTNQRWQRIQQPRTLQWTACNRFVVSPSPSCAWHRSSFSCASCTASW